MSQQHTQFEEEFRDGPQPVSYTTSVPPPLQSYVNVPGQKLLAHDLHTEKGPSAGQRLALAIVSLVFVFVTFMVTLGIAVGAQAYAKGGPLVPITVVFSLIFAAVVLILNVIFNYRH